VSLPIFRAVHIGVDACKPIAAVSEAKLAAALPSLLSIV